LGTFSYWYEPESACSSDCNNWWSSISAERPLSDLWSEIQITLPKAF
jgi:hypothetical protein